MKILKLGKGKMLTIGLDRLVMGLPYPKLSKHADGGELTSEELNVFDAQKKAYHAKMKHVEKMIKSGKYHCSTSSNKDLKRYCVYSEDDGALLCVISIGFSFGTGVINIAFNPSKLTSDNFAELSGHLSVMFYDHYEELYAKAVVSHAEFSVDVPGEELSNLILVDNTYRPMTKCQGSTYFGKQARKHVSVMYDKGQQLKLDGKLVRIEARLNDRTIGFPSIVEQDLANPLSNLLVLDVNRLQSVAQKTKMPYLAERISQVGLFEAVANKPLRNKVWTCLQEHAVPWWQPDAFWAAHGKLLHKLKPGHAGVFG